MRSRGPYQPAALLAAALVVGCQSGPDQGAGAPPEESSSDTAAAGPETRSDPAPTVDWAALGDCRARLRRLLQLVEAGPAPDPSDVPFVAVIRAGQEGWLSPRASYLRADLPIPVRSRHDGNAQSAPCLIEIGPAHSVDAQEQTTGTEQVRSAYQTGTRSENNSEYDVAKTRVRQAERRAKDAQSGVLEVGDPLLDLVGLLVGGVLSGFQEYNEEELDRALTELAGTPRKIDKPKHRAYHFERTTVRAAKAAVIPITLVDRRRERSWRVELRQRELREFHLLDGLDPRDRHYEQHRKGSMTRSELEQWSSRPPPIDLSTALAAVLEPSSETGSSTLAAGRGDVRSDERDARREAEPAAPPPGQDEPAAMLESIKGPQRASQDEPEHLDADYRPAADGPKDAATAGDRQGEGDRRAAVVKVTAGDRKGSGVYVDRYLVLTSYQLVQGAVVIDVGTADGETVAGLLKDADPRRDLALVQVPRTGSPVAWHAGPRLPPSSLVEVLIGRTVQTARIEADGGGARVRVDGDRPSGLFGAPVFLGGEAIGMVSALRDAGGRTLSVVAADEIARFLEVEPGTLATY